MSHAQTWGQSCSPQAAGSRTPALGPSALRVWLQLKWRVRASARARRKVGGQKRGDQGQPPASDDEGEGGEDTDEGQGGEGQEQEFEEPRVKEEPIYVEPSPKKRVKEEKNRPNLGRGSEGRGSDDDLGRGSEGRGSDDD